MSEDILLSCRKCGSDTFKLNAKNYPPSGSAEEVEAECTNCGNKMWMIPAPRGRGIDVAIHRTISEEKRR